MSSGSEAFSSTENLADRIRGKLFVDVEKVVQLSGVVFLLYASSQSLDKLVFQKISVPISEPSTSVIFLVGSHGTSV